MVRTIGSGNGSFDKDGSSEPSGTGIPSSSSFKVPPVRSAASGGNTVLSAHVPVRVLAYRTRGYNRADAIDCVFSPNLFYLVNETENPVRYFLGHNPGESSFAAHTI